VLARYCRGIDRCDIDTLKATFWDDAVVNYGQADSNAWAWAEATVQALSAMDRTQHAIGNVLIDLASSGEEAFAETYCRAYHEVTTPDGRKEMMVGGRYLDRLTRRGQDWRIQHRQYVMDFNQNGPSTAQWHDGLYAGLKIVGRRKSDDPLYWAR
jgi:ketosteroid isomerase-like protein